jgi:hypothetical protein
VEQQPWPAGGEGVVMIVTRREIVKLWCVRRLVWR